MNSQISNLRKEVEDLKYSLKRAESNLERAVQSCQHNFTEPKYDPIKTQGYMAGDEPGTMGSDYIPKHWIEGTTTPRWTRECKICGKVEQTTQTNQVVTKTPRF